MICDSQDETLEQIEEPNNTIVYYNHENFYSKSAKNNENLINNNRNNKNLILNQFSPSSTPSSLSRSESPANASRNFTEYDADLNIFNSDNENLDKNKNLLDKLLETVDAMKEEIGKS